jgi:hypothetical protein
LIGQIGLPAYPEARKINTLAGAARVDIAGVASSILATPTIFLFYFEGFSGAGRYRFALIWQPAAPFEALQAERLPGRQ